MKIFILLLLLLQTTPQTYWVTEYQCEHTKGQWFDNKGGVMLYNDTLYVMTKNIRYRARVDRIETIKGNDFIVTCCAAAYIEYNQIKFIAPNRELFILRRERNEKVGQTSQDWGALSKVFPIL